MKITVMAMAARLAQSVEHGTLNPGVVGSSPTLGETFFLCHLYPIYLQTLASPTPLNHRPK